MKYKIPDVNQKDWTPEDLGRIAKITADGDFIVTNKKMRVDQYDAEEQERYNVIMAGLHFLPDSDVGSYISSWVRLYIRRDYEGFFSMTYSITEALIRLLYNRHFPKTKKKNMGVWSRMKKMLEDEKVPPNVKKICDILRNEVWNRNHRNAIAHGEAFSKGNSEWYGEEYMEKVVLSLKYCLVMVFQTAEFSDLWIIDEHGKCLVFINNPQLLD